MKVLLILTIFLFVASAGLAKSEVSIQKNGSSLPAVESSFGNECIKERNKLRVKVMCYQCCIGELSGDQCKPFDQSDEDRKRFKV
jgi:hypothetical protein